MVLYVTTSAARLDRESLNPGVGCFDHEVEAEDKVQLEPPLWIIQNGRP